MTIGKTTLSFTRLVNIQHLQVPTLLITLHSREAEGIMQGLSTWGPQIEGDGSQTHPKIVSKPSVCQCSF